MDFNHSEKTKDYLKRIRKFMDEKIVPFEMDYFHELTNKNHGSDWTKWEVPKLLEDLKSEAKNQDLWNLFIDSEDFGGMLNVEYAPLAEQMGGVLLHPSFSTVMLQIPVTWKC